jgi:uncharacterized protein involved in outer membrane biogenesis
LTVQPLKAPERAHTAKAAKGGRTGSFHRRRPVVCAVLAALATLLLALVLFLWLADWNKLRGPIGRFASARLHRHVELDGDLKVRLFTLTPSVSVGDLRVGQPAWVGAGQMAEIGRLVIKLRLLSLLQGRLVLPLFEVDRPVLDLRRDASGRANWTFSGGGRPGKPFRVPPVQHFVVEGGKLSFVDAGRKIQLTGTLDSNERAGGAAAHAFSLEGAGEINRKPFRLKVSGGPLLNLRLDAPYPFTADVRAGATHVTADGALARPFDLADLKTRLAVSGEDLHDLSDLTGLALPNTPPYALKGVLTRKDQLYEVSGEEGRVGDSDLEGRLTIKVAPDTNRPALVADLRSRRLDIKDLAALFGARPAPRTPPARPGPAAPPARLLPDATLAVARLRGMDARLAYKAEAVNSGFLPIQKASLSLVLDHGLLSIQPVAFNFPKGRVVASARIDARGATPVSDIDARLLGLSLQELLPTKGPQPAIEGPLEARIRLHGRGDSVHRAAAASSGAATFVVPGGRVRQAFAELLGVNAGKGLGLLLSKNKGETGLRCAVADFSVEGGIMHARDVVFDTDVVRVNGTGQVDLGAETLDLTLKGSSKRFRVTHVLLPITIGGRLAAPVLGVKPGAAVAQGAAAVALGAVFTPFAAIIPFVDPGLAKNADCAGLETEARTGPAPLSAPPLAGRRPVTRR